MRGSLRKTHSGREIPDADPMRILPENIEDQRDALDGLDEIVRF
jgi:hypothetical protein